MSTVSGIVSTDTSAYSNYKSSAAKKYLASSKASESAVKSEAAAVYEKGDSQVSSSAITKTTAKYTQNAGLVAQLKADADERTSQLQSIVQQLITGQGEAYATASGDDVWKLFANGDFSNVSDAARAQAQADIAEGGYWSVDETANRIVDFAKALTGGDPDKIDTMIAAFKKGYEEATKAWGKELPEISSKTYDAVMAGFDDWRSEGTAATETV